MRRLSDVGAQLASRRTGRNVVRVWERDLDEA
jgi:hypothetical protein